MRRPCPIAKGPLAAWPSCLWHPVAEPDTRIEALADDVNHGVLHHDLKVDVWMLCALARDDRAKQQPRRIAQGIDPKAPGRARAVTVERLDTGSDRFEAGVQRRVSSPRKAWLSAEAETSISSAALRKPP